MHSYQKSLLSSDQYFVTSDWGSEEVHVEECSLSAGIVLLSLPLDFWLAVTVLNAGDPTKGSLFHTGDVVVEVSVAGHKHVRFDVGLHIALVVTIRLELIPLLEVAHLCQVDP